MALGRIVFSNISGAITVGADNENHKDVDILDSDSLNIFGRVIKLQRDIPWEGKLEDNVALNKSY